MGLTVIKTPQRNVLDDPVLASRWSAVHHPMIYTMHRRDYFITCEEHFSDPSLMIINVGLTSPEIITDNISVGESLYLETPLGSGTFVVDSLVLPNKIYVQRGSFDGYGSGYVNYLNRANYFIRTNIYSVDEFNNYVFVGQSINKPDATGRATVDVSSFLKQSVDYNDGFGYDILNQKDLSLGGAYNISYSENWIGSEGEFSAFSNTELMFFINSVQQIQDLYGQNMGEYVPFYFTSPPAEVPVAKFLSDFERPTYFPGFPFSLSFVYSEYLAGIVTTRNQEGFDVNGNPTTLNLPVQLDNAQVQNVNRMLINQNVTALTNNIDVWLETDGTIDCIKYQEPDYVAIGYVDEVCGLPVVGLPTP